MAVLYNANNEYLVQNNITSTINYNSRYTLMAWYYPEAVHATINLGFLWLSNTAITNYDVLGQESVSNGSNLYIGDSVSGFDYSSAAISASAWYHVAMVRYGSTLLRGFLNGVQFATDRTGNVGSRGAAARTWVGNPSASYHINARFAAIKLWDIGLSREEIQREMAQFAPATNLANVIGSWPMAAHNRSEFYGLEYPWTENGTLSDAADPDIPWRIAPPRPMTWWIPPPVTGGIIPLIVHLRRHQGIS